MSCPVNLDKVDLKLQWNPYTRDREATPLWWDEDTISDSFQQSNIIPAAAANFDERFSKFEERLASWTRTSKMQSSVLKFGRDVWLNATKAGFC